MQQITLGGQTFNLPYADLLPTLSADEYAALRADIIARGIVVPVVIDEQRNVIDGQHRLRIAADLGLVDVPMDIRPGLVDSEREALALDLNLHRRHLSKDQLEKVIIWRRQKGESYRAIAQAVGVSEATARRDVSTESNDAVELPTAIKGKDGKTRPAKRHKVRVESIRDVARAQEALSILPTEELPNKAIELKRLERIAREYQAEEQRNTPAAPVVVTPQADIRHGDFRTALANIPDGSIDLFLTDPPYPKDYLPLWRDLAALAARTLKPGGLLVAYSGQYYLPAVMGMLAEHLDYVWLGALVTPGQHNQVQQKHIRSACKPFLFYARPPYAPGPWFEDAYTSEERVKDDHDWQQSEGAARYYIECLTQPGGIVVDPFLGSGTTAVVAVSLGRNFIGCDVDGNAVNVTQRKLVA